MRVLLAGATGAIGQRLVPRLIAAGHDVTGIARGVNGLANSGARRLQADIFDRPGLLRALAGEHYDAVIHQATALSDTPATHEQMRWTNRLRWEGTSTLLAAARLTGARRFITASSYYGYGFEDHGPTPLVETDEFGALKTIRTDPVQEALVANEQQALAFGGTVLRYGLVYGDGPFPVVASDFDGVLPLIHLEDAAAAAVIAVEKAPPRAVYNIADDRPTSWRELQEAQAMAAGFRLPTTLPSWAIRAIAPFGSGIVTGTSMVLSTAKARRELGWEPEYPSFSEGLRAPSDHDQLRRNAARADAS